jgi:hypothetical protein
VLVFEPSIVMCKPSPVGRVRASPRAYQKFVLNQVFFWKKHKNVSPTVPLKHSQLFIALKIPSSVATNESFFGSPETLYRFKGSVG